MRIDINVPQAARALAPFFQVIREEVSDLVATGCIHASEQLRAAEFCHSAIIDLLRIQYTFDSRDGLTIHFDFRDDAAGREMIRMAMLEGLRIE